MKHAQPWPRVTRVSDEFGFDIGRSGYDIGQFINTHMAIAEREYRMGFGAKQDEPLWSVVYKDRVQTTVRGIERDVVDWRNVVHPEATLVPLKPRLIDEFTTKELRTLMRMKLEAETTLSRLDAQILALRDEREKQKDRLNEVMDQINARA